MKYELRFADSACDQLRTLHHWLAGVVDRGSADALVVALIDRCETLRDTPRLRTPRDDVRPGLRTIAFRRRYTIGYRVDGNVVTILGFVGRGQRLNILSRSR